MKLPYYGIAIIFIVFSVILACSRVVATSQQSVSATWVPTEHAQGEYVLALNRWNAYHINNYQITVQVFSSLLPPPCSSRFALGVADSRLISVIEIETPQPIELKDHTIVYNPGCHEYARFTPSALFEVIQEIFDGKIQYTSWRAKFDAKYGYISELVLLYGESEKDIFSTDLKVK